MTNFMTFTEQDKMSEEELEKMLFNLITSVSIEESNNIAAKGRLIKLPMKARTQPIIEAIRSYTQEKCREARIGELEGINRRVDEDEAKGKFASRSKYIRERIAELKAQ